MDTVSHPPPPIHNPNAKKKALFVGINYFGTSSELRGCIADVKNIHDWLVRT
jgi:AMMECR1 domain-containing protein